jgi:hypothetical protein
MDQRHALGVKLHELELTHELSLHGNRLSKLDHKRVYRGLYRWNCSHEAFFPHACKDGEALWHPPAELAKQAKPARPAKPAKSGSARRLLQFAWADLTEFEALRAYEEQRQLALRSGDGGGGGCAACAATCAAACAALLTCVALVLALACAWRAARRAARRAAC